MSEPTDGSPALEKPADEFGELPADAPWWARWFVDNWKQGWKWLSQWFFVLLGIVPVLREQSDWFQDNLSGPQFHYLMVVLAALGFISRFINQTKKE